MRIRRALDAARRLTALLVLALGVALVAAGIAEPREAADRVPDWRFVTGGRIRFAPAVSQDGTILCVADDRILRAVSASGRELWRFSLGGRPAGPPVLLDDGGICVALTDRRLVCVGPQGAERWRSDLDAAPVAAPALGRAGRLFVAQNGGLLASLDFRGRLRWSYLFKAEIVGSPAVGADGTVYLCTGDRLLHAISEDGVQRWAHALPGEGAAPAVGSTGVVYVSAFGIHAFAPDGALLWQFPVGAPTTGAVVGRDESRRSAELVVVGARNGFLHLVDASGSRVDEIELGGSLVDPPAFRADGALLVVSGSGLFRVRPGTAGAQVAAVRAKAAMSGVAISGAGVAYSGSEDWVLYAASFLDGVSSAPPESTNRFWPQPRRDAAQSARAAARSIGGEASHLILRELAASPLPAQKEEVLAAVRAHLAGERYLPLSGAEMEGLLSALVREGVRSPVYVGEQGPTDHPELRAAACALLGELGSPGARAVLIDAVENDPRGEVQSVAADALGKIGYDPDGAAARALAAVAERRRADIGALLVIVRALSRIAAASGPALGLGDAGPERGAEESLAARPAWQALVSLAAGRYPERVRVAAREALAGLLGGVRRY